MVYERVRYIDVPADGGSAVTTAGGILAANYATKIVDGRVAKVWVDQANCDANGSLWLLVSGTGETIAYQKGSMNADQFIYPKQVVSNTSSVALTGSQYTEAVCRDLPLYIVGSGLGNAKTVNKVRVYYY
jgi:hypothetical protein